MASLGWFVVILIMLVSIAAIIGNAGIPVDYLGIENLAQGFSFFLTNPNFSSSEDVFILPFMMKDKPSIDTEKLALKIHLLVNEERTKEGLNSLGWSSSMSKIAKKHSEDMILRNYYDHLSPERKDVADRYEQEDFICKKLLPDGSYLKGGENLALINGLKRTSDIAPLVVGSWMESPDHRKNILYNFYDSEGIGIMISDDELYITQNFC